MFLRGSTAVSEKYDSGDKLANLLEISKLELRRSSRVEYVLKIQLLKRKCILFNLRVAYVHVLESECSVNELLILEIVCTKYKH